MVEVELPEGFLSLPAFGRSQEAKERRLGSLKNICQVDVEDEG